MKIGISTYHKAHNYGALLQAVALRETLKQLGHDVYYVDYWPQYHLTAFAQFNTYAFKIRSFLGKINYIRKFLLHYNKINRRRRLFLNYITKYIDPYCLPADNEQNCYDAVVYGSDQIWKKWRQLSDEFDPFYFGVNNVLTRQSISYAASMGILAKENGDCHFIKETLSRFDALGVRENDLKALLEDCGLDNVHLCLDPTMLLDKGKWISLLGVERIKRKPYVLFYDLVKNSFDINAVKKFADSKNLELIVLKGSVNSNKYPARTIDEAGPVEFVSLIANADFIFTSSYHGLVFSILFEKSFYASYKSNSGRAVTLLSSLGLDDRLLPPGSDSIPDIKMKDYSYINESINKLREDSISFLGKSLCVR